MASTVATTSQFILDKVGGAENVANLTHCATRLRFQLVDGTKVDQDALDANPDVLGVVKQGSNGLQVVMGGAVANFYQEIIKLPGMGDTQKAASSNKKEYGGVRGKYAWVDYCFEVLSDTFRPILWALLGASLIITLLVLADTFKIQDFRAENQPPTFQFMHAMWKSVFYFLPVMVGATCARKLGANEWVGAAIPAALITPQFISLGSAGDTVTVFGLPMVLNDYSGQVFPPIISAIGLFWVEKLLKKIIPTSVQMVFVPFFSLLVMIPLTAFLLGPFGIGVGNGISAFLNAVNEFSPFILAIVIPLLYPFLVPLGLHWPLNAIMVQNLNSLGYDFIQGPMGAWNFACFGVVTGVFILSVKERNVAMRQVSMGGMMAGLLGGISEPSLYGVLLRYRRSYVSLIPGCLIGGVLAGLFDVKANAFVFTSLLTIPAMKPMGGYAIEVLVAFFVSMFLVLFIDYRTKEEKAAAQAALAEANAPAAAPAPAAAVAEPEKAAKPGLAAGETFVVKAPLAGEILPVSETPDPAFAQGSLGQGVCIKPSGNTVVAPADAKVLLVQKTGHAIALQLENGIQLLIHIGLDTVKMGGDGFEVHVSRNQEVKAGDKLITFDSAKIKAAGYSDVTPVVVSNTKKYAQVEALPAAAGSEATTDAIKITG